MQPQRHYERRRIGEHTRQQVFAELASPLADRVLAAGKQGRPNAGYVLMTGLFVQVDYAHQFRLGQQAIDLGNCLTANGIAVQVQSGNLPAGKNEAAIRILVGKKPQ